MDLSSLDAFFQSRWLMTAITIVCVVIVTAVVVHLATKALKHVLVRESGLLPSSSIFLNLARGILWILAACIILNTCFGVDVSAVIAALGVSGIALSLGLQDTIANLVGGLQISITKLVQPGDRIKVGGDSGVVTDITWRHVTLLGENGEDVIIPNASINKATLVKLPPAES